MRTMYSFKKYIGLVEFLHERLADSMLGKFRKIVRTTSNHQCNFDIKSNVDTLKSNNVFVKMSHLE